MTYVCTGCAYEAGGPSQRCPRCSRIASIVDDGRRPLALVRGAPYAAQPTSEVGFDEDDDSDDDEFDIDENDPDNQAPIPLNETESGKVERLKTNISALDRILGGGLVYGCTYVISGPPGAGKSRVVLQIIDSAGVKRAYYAGVEETGDKIHARAKDLKIDPSRIHCWPKKAPHLAAALTAAEDLEPEIVVIDSLQEMPVIGVRGRNERLMRVMRRSIRFSQETNTIMIIISRVSKDGTTSGTRDIEHAGDGTIYLTPMGIDEDDPRRRLRITKNRHGPAPKSLEAEMTANGLLFDATRRESKPQQKRDRTTPVRVATKRASARR